MRNFHKNLMLVGAGGPGALQTSPEWAETVLERNFPTSAGRGWEGGGEMHNFRKNLMLVGAGGPDALQTSPRMGGDDTGAESSDFCRTRTGGGRNAELPQEFDARGGLEGRTPSRPPRP